MAPTLIVTANQRLARTLRREYDEDQQNAGRRAWQAPQILPWPAWIHSLWVDAVMDDRLPPATLLTPDQSEALWRGIIEQSPGSRDILAPRSAALSAMSAWNLIHQHQIPWKRLAYAGHDDWNTFAGWAAAFERRTKSQNWLDESRLAAIVAQAIRAKSIPVPAHIQFAGFDEFTPQQATLLDALNEAGCTHQLLHPRNPSTPTLIRVEQLDPPAELRAAARWSRDLLAKNPHARIGLVIPKLKSERAIADRIFTEVFHPDWILGFTTGRPAFHISAGRTLSEWPVVHAALLAFKLLSPLLTLTNAGAILRSPFFGGGTNASERALADARLRRGRPAEVLTAAVDSWKVSSLAMPREQPASAWSATFAQLLATIGWPGEIPLTSAEYQTVEAWSDLLQRFASLDLVTSPLSLDEAIERVRELAAASEFQPEDPDAPVQITGALEAAGAGYGHLWIAGLDDESWPEAAHPHPFLPPSLQIEYRLPHCSAEREYEFAKRTTERLLASAPDIVVSHARRDGERALRPSVLIRGVPLQSEPAREDDYANLLARRSPLESIPDHAAPAYPAATAPGGTRILKSQAQCPFRAFAEVRLSTRRLEEGSLGIDPAERGNALHKALELFWREVKSQKALLALPPPELDALIRRVSREAVAKAGTAPAGNLDRRFRTLEIERTVAVLEGWLEHEAEREPFEVILREDERDIAVAGLILKTRVDRVDRLGNGQLVLLDYKSTAPSTKAWEGERLEEPQLPLYATSITEPIAAVAFAQLTPGELKFKGIAQSDALPGIKPLKKGATLDKKVAAWRIALEAIAREFQSGYAAVDPTKSACNFCGLEALCRIHEHNAAAEEENGDA